MRAVMVFIVSFVLFSMSMSVFSGETDYIETASIDLTKILPEPPREGSERYIMEMTEILKYQSIRTEEMIRYAREDQHKDVFRFATVLGQSFNAGDLPVTASFFSRTVSNGSRIADPAKAYWKRTRPYKANPEVAPCVKIPSGYSYPSSHALAGRLMAVILSRMIPEKRETILERGHEFAENRVIGGVHFRSDIEAGELAADSIAAAMFSDTEFLRDFESSKKEIRVRLGFEANDDGIKRQKTKQKSREKPAA